MEGKDRKIEVERTEAGKQTEAGKDMFELTESLKNHTITTGFGRWNNRV